MTDIHVQPERNAISGFLQAIDSVNLQQPEFVLTGGDLVMDALAQPFSRSDSLYSIYLDCLQRFISPVYNTIGNHELFAVYKNAGADTLHPMSGTGMYEQRIGKTYYSFMHGGWKFMVLNTIMVTPQRSYIGGIDSVQIAWIMKELSTTHPSTPICLSVHIPLMTVFAQVTAGATAPNSPGLVVTNAREILGLFKEHNLRLVLQGHLHYLEDITVGGVRFITCGSVASGWWKKENMSTPCGFAVFEIDGEQVEWQYKTYGWSLPR